MYAKFNYLSNLSLPRAPNPHGSPSPPPETRQTSNFLFSILYTSLLNKYKFFTFPSRVTLPWLPFYHFHSLLENCRDQEVYGDFNSHHSSWCFRTGDDRAAVREIVLVLDVNSLQQDFKIFDMLSFPSANGQLFSHNIFTVSRHHLPDVIGGGYLTELLTVIREKGREYYREVIIVGQSHLTIESSD